MASRCQRALLLAALAAGACTTCAGPRPPGMPAIPQAPNPQAAPGPSGSRAAATVECVDRELRRRGLNAYGDPEGTKYREEPPVPASERIDRVLARYPEIRTTCGVPTLR